mmetsp:Transcript_64791/g.138800  ORF Transcript_64791/g.138800 Transcript_64791/m.138800 type:complete len:182 (-) Transcript_64791:932-1477(-)
MGRRGTGRWGKGQGRERAAGQGSRSSQAEPRLTPAPRRPAADPPLQVRVPVQRVPEPRPRMDSGPAQGPTRIDVIRGDLDKVRADLLQDRSQSAMEARKANAFVATLVGRVEKLEAQVADSVPRARFEELQAVVQGLSAALYQPPPAASSAARSPTPQPRDRRKRSRSRRRVFSSSSISVP